MTDFIFQFLVEDRLDFALLAANPVVNYEKETEKIVSLKKIELDAEKEFEDLKNVFENSKKRLHIR